MDMHNYEIIYELGEERYTVTYCTVNEQEAQKWFLSRSDLADAILVSINRQKTKEELKRERAINTFSKDKCFILRYSVDDAVFEDEILAVSSSQAFLIFKEEYGSTHFDKIKILSIEENMDKSKEYLQQRIDAFEQENYTPKISPIEEQRFEREARGVALAVFFILVVLIIAMLGISSC